MRLLGAIRPSRSTVAKDGRKKGSGKLGTPLVGTPPVPKGPSSKNSPVGQSPSRNFVVKPIYYSDADPTVTTDTSSLAETNADDVTVKVSLTTNSIKSALSRRSAHSKRQLAQIVLKGLMAEDMPSQPKKIPPQIRIDGKKTKSPCKTAKAGNKGPTHKKNRTCGDVTTSATPGGTHRRRSESIDYDATCNMLPFLLTACCALQPQFSPTNYEYYPTSSRYSYYDDEDSEASSVSHLSW